MLTGAVGREPAGVDVIGLVIRCAMHAAGAGAEPFARLTYDEAVNIVKASKHGFQQAVRKLLWLTGKGNGCG